MQAYFPLFSDGSHPLPSLSSLSPKKPMDNNKRKLEEAQTDKSNKCRKILAIIGEQTVRTTLDAAGVECYQAVYTKEEQETFPELKCEFLKKTTFDDMLAKKPILVHPYVLEEYEKKKEMESLIADLTSELENQKAENAQWRKLLEADKQNHQELLDRIHVLTHENITLKEFTEKTEKDTPQRLKILTEDKTKLSLDLKAANEDRSQLRQSLDLKTVQLHEARQKIQSLEQQTVASDTILSSLQEVINQKNTTMIQNMATIHTQLASTFQEIMNGYLVPASNKEAPAQFGSVMNGDTESTSTTMDPNSFDPSWSYTPYQNM